MTPTLLAVAAFVGLLALVPTALKWMQARVAGGAHSADVATRLISAVAVGPQQRVVTIEVGPPDGRTMLVLGVTQQSVTCLHSFAAGSVNPARAVGAARSAVAGG